MEQLHTQHIDRSKNNPDDTHRKVLSRSRPTGAVYSGISELDDLLGGLYTGQVTTFIGKSVLLSTLLHRVCVNTFDMFHSHTIVLDAGNQLNPFILARLAQKKMISDKRLLQHVYLSRAYTVYQLTDLIHSQLESLIQQVKPVTIILTGFFSLLDDADISRNEQSRLLPLVMKQIKQMTTEYQVAMILIDTYHSDYALISIDAWVDTAIRVHDMRHCPRITITQNNQQVTVTSETVGQLCLQDFGLVI